MAVGAPPTLLPNCVSVKPAGRVAAPTEKTLSKERATPAMTEQDLIRNGPSFSPAGPAIFIINLPLSRELVGLKKKHFLRRKNAAYGML
jgi:hypothetical protein